MKLIGAKTTGYTLPQRIHEINDLILMLKSLLCNEVKVFISKDDTRLK